MDKRFVILQHSDKGTMEDEVTEYMAKGWFPYGPVEIKHLTTYTRYIVTMMFMQQTEKVPTIKAPTIH